MFAYCGNNPVNMMDPTGYLSLTSTKQFSIVMALGVSLTALALSCVDEIAIEVKDKVAVTANIENTKDQSVYVLTDSENNVKYVGRTNNPARREYEHKHDPKHPERKNYQMTIVATGLNVPEAKITEQVLISAYTLSYLDNARREISAGNLAGYRDNMAAVMQIFEGLAEDELMNLMGR